MWSTTTDPPTILPNGLTQITGTSPLFPNISILVIDLKIDERGRDKEEFERLALVSGRRTVPVVFLGGEWIGGGDDIKRMGSDGTLLTKLLLSSIIDNDFVNDYIKQNKSVRIPPLLTPTTSTSKTPIISPIIYNEVIKEIKGLIESESDLIANASNISSAIYNAIISSRGVQGCNWVGFYFTRRVENDGEERVLVLGPFMGKPACRRIRLSEGVCGAAARTKEVQLVKDVHDFPGHIACDSASNSEVVIPLLSKENEVLGVFDLDCPVLNGYSEEDAEFLEKVGRMLVEGSDWGILDREVEASEGGH